MSPFCVSALHKMIELSTDTSNGYVAPKGPTCKISMRIDEVKWCRWQEALPEIKGVANQGVYRQAVKHDVSPHCTKFISAGRTRQYASRVAAPH